jgi:RNA polymerase sigma factor (sigma-70 family)
MTEDSELLNRFLLKSDEPAFAELVRRHLNHVYSTALRLVGGDQHLAEDVAQTVFADLARKAAKLQNYQRLSSWLHTSTRFAAAKVVRSEQRRHIREQETLSMEQPVHEPGLQWSQTRPILDESLGELDEMDKQALLLRYFEAKAYGDIGGVLGLTESGARMRVERALDKLRTRLAFRGITSTAIALGTALAQNAVIPAPPALSGRIVSGAVKAGLTAEAERGATMIAKLSVGAFVVIIASFLSVFGPLTRHPHAGAITGASVPAVVGVAAEPGNSAQKAPAKPRVRSASGIELTFLDDVTGLPITNKTVFLRGWQEGVSRMVEEEVELRDAGDQVRKI